MVKPDELQLKQHFEFTMKVILKHEGPFLGKEGTIIKWELDESEQGGKWVVYLHDYRKDFTFSATSLEACEDEFEITLDRTNGSRVGIMADHQAAWHVEVVSVTGEGGFLMRQWNDEHPGLAVRPGDRIVGINGLKGHSRLIMGELQKNKVLKMVIRRRREASGDESTPPAARATVIGTLADDSLDQLKILLARKDLKRIPEDVYSLEQAILFCYAFGFTEDTPDVEKAWKQLELLDTDAEKQLRLNIVVQDAEAPSSPSTGDQTGYTRLDLVNGKRRSDKHLQKQVAREREALKAKYALREVVLRRGGGGLRVEDLADLKRNIVNCNKLGVTAENSQTVQKAWAKLQRLNQDEWTALKRKLRPASP
jgi:hypothetical protein